jgi:hypothetical protein
MYYQLGYWMETTQFALLLTKSAEALVLIEGNYSALKKESSLLRNKRGAVKCISKRINHAF